VIPEIDIWRVAYLMLKRYGDEADIESAIRAEELAEEGDHNGAAVWWLVTSAIEQLANRTPRDWCTNLAASKNRRGSASGRRCAGAGKLLTPSGLAKDRGNKAVYVGTVRTDEDAFCSVPLCNCR